MAADLVRRRVAVITATSTRFRGELIHDSS
jgi:hypothetical protein